MLIYTIDQACIQARVKAVNLLALRLCVTFSTLDFSGSCYIICFILFFRSERVYMLELMLLLALRYNHKMLLNVIMPF